ncbi:unnamed protein product [Dibothriocephalus latus]|uniref:Uncharacterized protein n=1 Tax=Dibothriocephalus latus TaxID=60516 RepID=A0A3P7M958_DIBLA|nr:unnamed protein product [Dibothriocephalus latus]
MSTTDNDSNATFRVLSEVDARTSYSNNGGFSISSTRASTKETSGVPFNHEDSGTTSELMTMSSGWKTTPRFSTTDSKLQQQQQQQHAASCLKSSARGSVKMDLPELVAGLPASPQSQYHQKPRNAQLKRLKKGHEHETQGDKVEEREDNDVEDEEEVEESARNKRYSSPTFSSPQPINETFKFARCKMLAGSPAQEENSSKMGLMRTSLSRAAFRDEYENLEVSFWKRFTTFL